MNMKKKPFKSTFVQNKKPTLNRVLIFTPTIGSLRIEWVNARYTATVPTNFSIVNQQQLMPNFGVDGYMLADAENLMAKVVTEQNFEWVITIEHDNVIPPDFFVKMNQYMQKGKEAIVTGLYFTKSFPAEPIIYKGRGNGCFRDFKMGDKFYVDGCGFGMSLINGNIIREVWKDSEEYMVGAEKTRRVFRVPDRTENVDGNFNFVRGTTDLDFYTRVHEGGYYAKAGFPHVQKRKYPILCDSTLFGLHVSPDGRMYPMEGIPADLQPKQKQYGQKTRKRTPRKRA